MIERSRLAWWTWLAAMALIAAGVGFLWLNRSNPDQGAGFVAGAAVFGVACATVGGLVATRRPEHPIGWLFAVGALLDGVGILASGWASYALVTEPGSLPGGEAAVLLVPLLLPGLTLPVLFGALLFPSGRLPSPRWRPVGWLAGGGLALALVATLLRPGPIPEYGLAANPLGIEGAAPALDPLRALGFLLITLTGAAAVGALVLRGRRARGEERQQLKWFTFTAAVAVLALTLGVAFASDAVVVVQLLALPLLPAAVGVAILRHRLWDIDVLLNRSLVYAALTACVIGLYVGVVTLLGALLRDESDLLASLPATALVALAFQPLRERLQHGVNRLMYGERDDPYGVMARVGRRLEATLEPEDVLPAVAETVARALRLSSVSVELRRDGRLVPVVAHGQPAETPEAIELTYRGEPIGRMLAGPRAAGETLSPSDRRLLEALAPQVGVAAHAVGLTADLQRSRERLVTAREEERRRVRRELHDGLGPTLAGVAMQIGAARDQLASDAAATEALLARVEAQARGAVVDIRSLAYELRPPALDELGLVRALRERAAAASGRNGGLAVFVRVAGAPRELSAAVEVAAYRIAAEAVANVARHAEARRCCVRLSFGAALGLEIADDGRGLGAGFRAGVGIGSMRERAAELGGRLSIEPGRDGGTRVLAHLPLGSP